MADMATPGAAEREDDNKYQPQHGRNPATSQIFVIDPSSLIGFSHPLVSLVRGLLAPGGGGGGVTFNNGFIIGTDSWPVVNRLVERGEGGLAHLTGTTTT